MPTYREVEERLAARVGAIDATPFNQGSVVAAWRESNDPLTVVEDSSVIGHLLYNVWIQNAPNAGLARAHETPDDEDDVWTEAIVIVAFAYHLRARQRIADQRIGNDAAVAVVRAILAPWTAADVSAIGAVNMRLVDGLQPALTPDGEWLLITQNYLAGFDLSLAA